MVLRIAKVQAQIPVVASGWAAFLFEDCDEFALVRFENRFDFLTFGGVVVQGDAHDIRFGRCVRYFCLESEKSFFRS